MVEQSNQPVEKSVPIVESIVPATAMSMDLNSVVEEVMSKVSLVTDRGSTPNIESEGTSSASPSSKSSRKDESEVEEEPISYKNGIKVLPPVPRVLASLQPHHQLLPVGVVLSTIGTRVIVEGAEEHGPVNEGGVLWITEARSILGLVDEFFGPKNNRHYSVRYNSESEVPAGISYGTHVSFAVEFSDYVLDNKELNKKGYDADEVTRAEFSDDEKELSPQQATIPEGSKYDEPTPDQAKMDMVEPTPEQAMMDMVEPTPEQAKMDMVEPTPEQAKMDEVEPTPEQAKVDMVEPTPEQAKMDEVEPTPEQAKVDMVEPTPEEAKMDEVEPTPEEAKVDMVEPTPEQAKMDMVEPTPEQANMDEVEPTPEEAKVYMVEPTPEQAKMHMVEPTPEQAKMDMVEPTPEQAKMDEVEPTPEEAKVDMVEPSFSQNQQVRPPMAAPFMYHGGRPNPSDANQSFMPYYPQMYNPYLNQAVYRTSPHQFQQQPYTFYPNELPINGMPWQSQVPQRPMLDTYVAYPHEYVGTSHPLTSIRAQGAPYPDQYWQPETQQFYPANLQPLQNPAQQAPQMPMLHTYVAYPHEYVGTSYPSTSIRAQGIAYPNQYWQPETQQFYPTNSQPPDTLQGNVEAPQQFNQGSFSNRGRESFRGRGRGG